MQNLNKRLRREILLFYVISKKKKKIAGKHSTFNEKERQELSHLRSRDYK